MELNVIQKTRDLCDYVLTVTHKSPKEFRFTLIDKLHGYVLSAMENLLRANELGLKDPGHIRRRKQYQLDAMTDLKLLGYMADLARSQKCILPKQYEQISIKLYDCRNLLGAWVRSDAKRLQAAAAPDAAARSDNPATANTPATADTARPDEPDTPDTADTPDGQ